MGDTLIKRSHNIKILVVDDHPVVRRGIRHMVEEEQDMTVAAEASDGSEALSILEHQSCDIVMLDLTLPQESGFDVFEEIKARHPGLPVLIISMYSEEQAAVRAIKAGAAGYLCKDTIADVLVSAIRKVVNGGKFITPTLAEHMAIYLEGQEIPLHENLSPREFRVMCMLAMGKSLKQIGEELCLSIKTISTYKTRVFEKMQFQNNAELVKYAVKFHLVEDMLPLTKS
ncbi:MAG: response regulator transcription factor [Candidatus Riflebacteria bacterium]|nr:response regulator transcription factor [Candidatus Riflebacteria bacterium]